MNLLWNKITALTIMMLLSLFVGLLPLKVRKLLVGGRTFYDKSEAALSASLCFGAGILMGTVFLHLLPETRKNVEAAQEGNFITDTHYPIAELILCSGFFSMYCLEEIIHLWVHRNQDDTEDHLIHHHHNHNAHIHHHDEHNQIADHHQYNKHTDHQSYEHQHRDHQHHHDDHQHHNDDHQHHHHDNKQGDHHDNKHGDPHHDREETKLEVKPQRFHAQENGVIWNPSYSQHSDTTKQAEQRELQKTAQHECRYKRKRCESWPTVAVLVGCDNPIICTESLNNNCAQECNDEECGVKIKNNTSNVMDNSINEVSKNRVTAAIRSILVVMALSIHGCLEGLALGFEGEIKDVWLLFGGLSAHKIAIAFSIGMELLEKGVKTKIYCLYMTLFALASPFGGILGALSFEYANHETASSAIAIMILQGISGGTIMYVLFCEVLERERSKSNGRLSRLLALTIGFIVMSLLELITHEHSHGANEGMNSTTQIPDIITSALV